MSLFVYIPVLLAGFLVLAWSADRFVGGAAATARHFGMSPLVVGLTIVGFGTSAPEMLVSALASWQGSPGIAIGNAIGSNITNTSLILGTTALLVPLTVHSRLLRRETPVLLAVMGLTFLMMLNGTLGRWEGVALLVVLAALLSWMGLQARRSKAGEEPLVADFEAEIPADMPLARALIQLAIGLALLLGSAQMLVWAAVGIAKALGVSDLVIGLTVVALGTSLPELAASIASARKGEHDMAVGNVIGSNLFNLLAVLGIAVVIKPARIDPATLWRDYPIMVALTVGFLLLSFVRRTGHLGRLAGTALLAAYVAYQVLLYLQTTGRI